MDGKEKEKACARRKSVGLRRSSGLFAVVVVKVMKKPWMVVVIEISESPGVPLDEAVVDDCVGATLTLEVI